MRTILKNNGFRNWIPLAATVLLLASAAQADFFSRRPRWTRARPHFEVRHGHKFAIAVGTAKDANPSLARSTAEDRARVDLLRLVQGKPPVSIVEGWLRGAQDAEVYNAGGGKVYVRLELDLTPAVTP